MFIKNYFPFVLCLIPLTLIATSATHVEPRSNKLLYPAAGRRIKFVNSLNRQNWIIGGDIASILDFPFMVSIQSFHSTWSHYCSGSILNSKMILTACHCIYSRRYPLKLKTPTYTRIVAGVEDWRYKTRYRQLSRATKFVPHPNCGDRMKGADLYHDIAAITLATPLKFTQHVQPVKLFSKDKEKAHAELKRLQETGAECTSPGWGLIHTDPDISSPRLKYARKKLLTTKQCRKTLCGFGSVFCINYDEYDQMCALGHNSSVCNGDSGGPLICNGYLFGSVSYGVYCGIETPQVYSNVVPILDFANYKTG